jgi:hypothetical protein
MRPGLARGSEARARTLLDAYSARLGQDWATERTCPGSAAGPLGSGGVERGHRYGYRSSACEADTLVRERLGAVHPARPDRLVTSASLRIAEGRNQSVA